MIKNKILKPVLIGILPHAVVLKYGDWKRKKTLKENFKGDNLSFEIVKDYLLKNKIHKLQIASGKNILDGWLNSDYLPQEGIVKLDAKDIFPFNKNTFDYVFCEHFVEHLTLDENRFFLKEVYRILKPGGIFRVSTPDLLFVLSIYKNKSKDIDDFVKWYKESFCKDKDVNDSQVWTINNFFNGGGHKYLYDYQSLADELTKTDFVDIKRVEVGKSEYKDLVGVECHSKVYPERFNLLESMVVEAKKTTEK